MKEILTKKLQTILIDDEFYHYLSLNKWYINAKGYAERQVQKNYKRKAVLMHHVIIGRPPENKIVDHINGNKLDNRKENLRFITKQQNQFNRKKERGVSFNLGKWDSYIMINRKKIYLGRFVNREDALRIRKQAEKKYFFFT